MDFIIICMLIMLVVLVGHVTWYLCVYLRKAIKEDFK